MSDESLSPAQRARIRRLSTPREPEPGDEAGELNVVPYLDIMMNIMMFVLASVSVAFASTINTSAAYAGPGPVPPTPGALHLTVLVTSSGTALKTAAGPVAPGCTDMGPGIAVPIASGQQDLAALARCARWVKQARPAETQVSVTASPDIPYETVISVLDALRADADGPLFPDVAFGTVR
jgi:biopolymer transport protein ExbD